MDINEIKKSISINQIRVINKIIKDMITDNTVMSKQFTFPNNNDMTNFFISLF